jgi:hypothetical protein
MNCANKVHQKGDFLYDNKTTFIFSIIIYLILPEKNMSKIMLRISCLRQVKLKKEVKHFFDKGKYTL